MAHSFHRGELDVQKRAGVEDVARKVANGTRDDIPSVGKAFLEDQVMAVLGSVGEQGDVWASSVTGEPGFIHVVTPNVIDIGGSLVPGDPLVDNLASTRQCGMIAIEFSSRRRMRVNGLAGVKDGHIWIDAREVYSNCPRYIQARKWINDDSGFVAPESHVGVELNRDQELWIAKADTFFIASFHPEAGVDASHKGGNPGFVKVQSGVSLTFPDYNGNRMFNTLGNISINPNAGLLFIDFDTGSTLQLSGQAEILWDRNMIADFPGAERLVKFTVKRVIETKSAFPVRWKFVAFSPFLPAQ